MRRQVGQGAAARLTLMAAVAAVVVTVAACASSGAAASNPGGAIPGDTQSSVERNATLGEAYPAASAAASAAAASQGPADNNGSQAVDTAPQVVYTGSLQLVVGDLNDALARAKVAVDTVGGFVGASQESNNGDRPTATITYRIPAPKWDDTVTAIRGIATKVVSEQTQATEIGGQLVDLQARIANLRASEAALQKIAEGAGKISDLLQVEQQLTDVRGQIEELDAQRARLQDQVQYGTLVTTFGLEVAQVKEAAKGWDPATDVDGATATMVSVGQRIVSGAIWFGIVWLPFLIVLSIASFAAWRVGRRFFRIPSGPGVGGGPIAGWSGGDDAPQG